MIELPRRKFLIGLTGLIAAPAIVRAASLMPVRSFAFDGPMTATECLAGQSRIQAEIAELLCRSNSIFDDIQWREASLLAGYKSIIRTKLPAGSWRAA